MRIDHETLPTRNLQSPAPPDHIRGWRSGAAHADAGRYRPVSGGHARDLGVAQGGLLSGCRIRRHGALPGELGVLDDDPLGSCSFLSRAIRLSHRLCGMPAWVVDTVLTHEMCRLIHSDHGPAFRALLARYPDSERADALLAGWSAGDGLGWADWQITRPDDVPPRPG